MFAAKDTLLTRPSGGYQISRSLRFNSADSTYLSRTPASATNRKTYTFSTWVKRSQLNSGNAMLATVNGSAFNYFSFGTSTGDFLTFAYYDGATDIFGVNTNSSNIFYRDVSAWYHIVLYVDTTQATASNRVKFYVNNVEQTGLSGTYPTLNYDTQINSIISTIIGGGTGPNTAYLSDQYMTEINFIDGQALTPSSFGQTDAQTGVWGPKAYSGSYGTNGFYLNFSDNSNTTAATLGKDYSGNGNNWTPNNFSVTAGAGNDSLVDVPTSFGTDTGVGGTVRGNYCTLNPLYKNGAGTPAITNGNLDMLAGGTGDSYFGGTFSVSSGKWYYECLINAVGTGGTSILIGICKTSAPNGTNVGSYRSTSEIYNLDGTAQTAGATYAAGDTIGVAIDIDAGTVKFYKNNTGQGATPSFTFTAGTEVFVRGRSDSANPSATFNFGQRPFLYTAPSGFKALCTQNLPTPTIGATTATQAGKFFNPLTWTATGTTQAVTGMGLQPDFLWIKDRQNANGHNLVNNIVGSTIYLSSDSTNAETTATTLITSIDSDGFTMGTGNYGSGRSMIAWGWKGNGSGSSNTSGSITSTVSASTTSGFSVLTYTGTAVAATIGHGLGSAPSMIIVKQRNGGPWPVYHTSLGIDQYVFLNTTAAANTVTGYWGTTSPSSTVFGVIGGGYNNNSGPTVAYCFAEIAGYSKIGSYIGTGSLDSPFVYCGFRPAVVMIKNASATQPWNIQDDARSTSNVVDNYLRPNTNDAEASGYAKMDFVSNGFKIRDSDAFVNGNGNTMIFMAFADNPFKYSLAR